MADHTKIEWTDATWNPVTGCSVVSPGCTNCYAMKLAGTRLQHHPSRAGLTRETKAGPVWNGTVRFNEEWLTQPLQWKRPRMVFVCAHGDLFHEDVPDEWIDRVFAVMALAPQHTFQILTKRPSRMRRFMSPTTPLPMLGRLPLERIHCAAAGDIDGEDSALEKLKPFGNLYSLYCSVPWPLPNVWLGVSAEDQPRWDERVNELRATPAAIRFVSAEPLLGPIHDEMARLDWVIVGGENGPRPMKAEWAQSIRDQCAAAGTAFFFKQWGSHIPAGQTMANGKVWSPGCGTRLRATKGITGRLLDGVEHNGMPSVYSASSEPNRHVA